MAIIKKAVSVLLTCCLALAFLPTLSQSAYAAGSASKAFDDSIPIEYFSAQDTDYDPPYEEGKINLTGKVSLADDKQLVQDLRWSFPFENPQRPGEGIADPNCAKSWRAEWLFCAASRRCARLCSAAGK